MSYSIGPGKPKIRLRVDDAQRLMAAKFNELNITTNAQRDALLNSALQTVLNDLTRALIRCFDLS